MWLINKIFNKNGNKDREQIKIYPATFCNIAQPYDKENHAARYYFLQCPNAEFAEIPINAITVWSALKIL
ncbi:hypothetical protein [Ruminococcus sp.]|uniref:hypothetical protein n=1 Tax=Ruminococcus sp. TaxID=41978 RepID=UPI003868D70A